MAEVKVAGLLREIIGGNTSLNIEGETVLDVICALADRFPKLRDKLLKGDCLSMQTVISVDNRDIRLLNNEYTQVDESSVIHLLPALVGG